MQAVEFQTKIRNGMIEIPQMYRQQISKRVRVIIYSEEQSQDDSIIVDSFEKRPLTASDLLQSGLVGIWADREEISDSLEFARQLRQTAEHRRGDTHVVA